LTRVRAIGLGVLLAVIAIPAFAVVPAQHTVDWYRSHQQARENVLRTCQNDHSTDNEAECRNALSGSHDALADSLVTSRTKDPEASPAYYEHDAGMIAMTLAMCTRHEAPPSWCKAAQTASDNRTR
jgi:hypothetical protein